MRARSGGGGRGGPAGTASPPPPPAASRGARAWPWSTVGGTVRRAARGASPGRAAACMNACASCAISADLPGSRAAYAAISATPAAPPVSPPRKLEESAASTKRRSAEHLAAKGGAVRCGSLGGLEPRGHHCTVSVGGANGRGRRLVSRERGEERG